MKSLKRVAAFVLALVLCLSAALPALAAAKDITKNLKTSIVLVTCNYNGDTRKGTGIVVGKLSDPKQSAIVVDPWVIFDLESANVVVNVNGKKYEERCLNVDGQIGVIRPVNAYGAISPIVLGLVDTFPSGTGIIQAYNNGANKVFGHSGFYIGYEEDESYIGQFDNGDLNRIQPEPWKSLGTAILTELNNRYVLLGMAQSVVPSSNAIYFRNVIDIVVALLKMGIGFDSEGEIVPEPTPKPTDNTQDTIIINYMNETNQLRQDNMSREELTQTIVLVVAGLVIVAAIVVLVLLLMRRNKGGMAIGKAAFAIIGVTGQYTGREFPVKGTLVIGRGATCNVMFANNTPGISNVHCQVSAKGGRLYLTDTGSSYGTMDKTGRKLLPNQPIELQKGDTFYLATKDNGFMVK